MKLKCLRQNEAFKAIWSHRHKHHKTQKPRSSEALILVVGWYEALMKALWVGSICLRLLQKYNQLVYWTVPLISIQCILLGQHQAELLNRFSNRTISFLKNLCPHSWHVKDIIVHSLHPRSFRLQFFSLHSWLKKGHHCTNCCIHDHSGFNFLTNKDGF